MINSDKIFLQTQFYGNRFNNHLLPLDILQDVYELNNLVVKVAKKKYFEKNPDRKRLPKNFENSTSVCLLGMEEGSVILNLALHSSLLLFPVNQSYFEEARNEILSSVNAVEKNEKPSLSQDYLSQFESIGKHLREDESISFRVQNDCDPTIFTKQTRIKLIQASKKREYCDEIILRGVVVEYNKDNKTGIFKTFDGKFCEIPIEGQSAKDIIKAFNNYKGSQNSLGSEDKFLFSGEGVFSTDKNLKKITRVINFDPLDPLDPISRLDEFRNLKNGWLDGYGISVSKSFLDWLSLFFQEEYPDNIDYPYLYPMEDGGIIAEWDFQNHLNISLEINEKNHYGEWHLFDNDSNNEEEEIFDLNDRNSISLLFKKLADNQEGNLNER